MKLINNTACFPDSFSGSNTQATDCINLRSGYRWYNIIHFRGCKICKRQVQGSAIELAFGSESKVIKPCLKTIDKMKNKNEVVYMALDWQSKCPTKRLGRINWALAVRFAKKQNCDTVRLSTSDGYNNQGSYIRTNKV